MVQHRGGRNIDIDELRKIHFEKTGKMLFDQEALEMGARLVTLLRIVYKPNPEETAESDE